MTPDQRHVQVMKSVLSKLQDTNYVLKGGTALLLTRGLRAIYLFMLSNLAVGDALGGGIGLQPFNLSNIFPTLCLSLVDGFIVVNLTFSVFSRRDTGCNAAHMQVFSEPISIITTI